MRIRDRNRKSRGWRALRRARLGVRLYLRALARTVDPVGKATLALSPVLLLGWLAASASLAGARAGGARSLAEAPAVHGQRSLERYREVRLEAAREWAEWYEIPLELAHSIQEAALGEGLDPPLAFRLVRVESSFRRRAVGPRGSVGFTQVRPSTARWLDPTVTRERLFETETNLRLGFRYLGMLLRQYDHDTRLALLAYNRGPGTVASILAVGEDPGNGYASRVLGSPPSEPAAGAPGGDVGTPEGSPTAPAAGVDPAAAPPAGTVPAAAPAAEPAG